LSAQKKHRDSITQAARLPEGAIVAFGILVIDYLYIVPENAEALALISNCQTI